MILLSTLLLLPSLAGDPIPVVTLKTPPGAHEPQVGVWGEDPTEGECATGSGQIFRPRVFVTYGTKDAVYISTSHDAAESFDEPVKISDVGVLSLGMRRGPRIAVVGSNAIHQDSVVVTAIAGDLGGGRDGDLLAWRSSDGAKTWSRPVRLNDVVASAREGLHALAVGPKGVLYCAWIDGRNGAPVIMGASSGDGGANWSHNDVIDASSGALCPCCHPSVAFSGETLFVMWRGARDGSRDMMIAESKNLGRSFSPARKIGTGTWKLDACPMDGGGLASAIGRTYAVWRRDRQVFRTEGLGEESLVGDGEQPCAATGPLGLYVLWLRKRDGPLMLTWTGCSAPQELDSVANDPAISKSARGPVVAVWESGPRERAKIVAARIGGSPIKAR